MMKYILISGLAIGGPLLAFTQTYHPMKSDHAVRVPMIDYKLENSLLTYTTTLNSIKESELIKTPGVGLKVGDERAVNIHLVSGPNESAYPYMMTNIAAAYEGLADKETYYVKGRAQTAHSGQYQIEYGVEKITLPAKLSEKLQTLKDEPVKAVWRVRKTGQAYFSGLEIDGEYMPYQFNLKDVLLGRTQ